MGVLQGIFDYERFEDISPRLLGFCFIFRFADRRKIFPSRPMHDGMRNGTLVGVVETVSDQNPLPALR